MHAAPDLKQTSSPLWQPPEERKANANLTAFITELRQSGLQIDDVHKLWEWSVKNPEVFWTAVWNFCGIISSSPWRTVLGADQKMPGAVWFEGARLNFAQNLLRFNDDSLALVFWGEERVRRTYTYAELHRAVAPFQQQLKSLGVKAGDRVAAFIPNMPEAVIGMLATTSLGAIWSSCSPDFGVEGVVDRFGQIAPKLLLCADGYYYKDRPHDSLKKLGPILEAIPSIEQVVVAPYLEAAPKLPIVNAALFPAPAREPVRLEFEQLPFDHPLYILYSSGTTGKPKCIVHGAGGTLLEHLKELVLHTDLSRQDRIVYATTCGWMMWNWLVSSLAVGATTVLYDGAPLQRGGKILFDLLDHEQITVFGTSASYLAGIEKAGLKPRQSHKLSQLKTVLSTGSPLLPESFDFVYRDIKSDLLLASISGGTDIIGCFALGSPLLPVYRGELQTRSLGYAVDVFDEAGQPIRAAKGELVCTKPFPSMPVGFWNDPDGSKYHQAYFERFPGVWRHGDFVELTEHNGMIIYGRSDAVLNPGGVRIGTAEIYRQVEKIPEVLGSIVVGQEWQNDTRVVLFVKLKENIQLTEDLKQRIIEIIRSNTTPRHVPRKIIPVGDIPVTRSGKISELAVRNVIHGIELKNLEALANPESLECFRELEELRHD